MSMPPKALPWPDCSGSWTEILLNLFYEGVQETLIDQHKVLSRFQTKGSTKGDNGCRAAQYPQVTGMQLIRDLRPGKDSAIWLVALYSTEHEDTYSSS